MAMKVAIHRKLNINLNLLGCGSPHSGIQLKSDLIMSTQQPTKSGNWHGGSLFLSLKACCEHLFVPLWFDGSPRDYKLTAVSMVTDVIVTLIQVVLSAVMAERVPPVPARTHTHTHYTHLTEHSGKQEEKGDDYKMCHKLILLVKRKNCFHFLNKNRVKRMTSPELSYNLGIWSEWFYPF